MNLAIVEDELEALNTLKAMIEKYKNENNLPFDLAIDSFSSGEEFLENFKDYHVIFLDIQMGGISGMDTAREIRKRDGNVLIVFVTNMSQYAIESYEVEAYDFILKPVSYGNFFMKFRRILKKIAHSSIEEYLTLTTRYETRKVKICEIVYIESISHNIIFHLENDEEVRITGSTLNDWENKLAPYYFIRINSGFLINLKFVTLVKGDYVTLGKDELHISRSRKQCFTQTFAKYVGGSL